MSSQPPVVLSAAEILSLPRDIVLSVLFTWLELAECAMHIDRNLCNHGLRAIYLSMLDGVVAPSTPPDVMGENYLAWINSRGLKLAELSLERKSHSPPTARFIDSVLQCCQGSLRELSLSHVYGLSNDQFLQIFQACKTSLRAVEIDNCYDVDATVLDPLLTQASHIERLSLIGFNLSSLPPISSASSPITSLKIVTDVSPQVMQALLQACPLLERLDLELDDQQPHLTYWIDQLATHCASLRSLHLNAYNPADRNLLQRIAQQLPELRELSVEEAVDERGVLESLLHPHHASTPRSPAGGRSSSDQFHPLEALSNLTSLGWQGPNTTPRQMLALVGSFTSLRKADFRYNAGVDNEVVIKLVCLNKQLEELILPSSWEANEQLSDFTMEAIAEYCEKLRVLSVPFGGAITDIGLNALANAEALEELYLGPMPRVTEEGIMELGIQLEGQLKRLTLFHENLSAELQRILCSLSIQVRHC